MSATLTESAPSVAEEIANGDKLTVSQLATERQIHGNTVFKWITAGLPGPNGARVFLAAIRFGRGWVTSRAAFRRFLASLPTND